MSLSENPRACLEREGKCLAFDWLLSTQSRRLQKGLDYNIPLIWVVASYGEYLYEQ